MTGEMVVKLVSESDDELVLKNFLKKIEHIFGEDFALETLSSNIDLAKSINQYSKAFDSINNTSIVFILLKSFVLSLDKDNYLDNDINNYILKENIEELKELIKNNLMYRKHLVRKLIRQSNIKNMDLYKKQNDKSLVYEELEILNVYERTSKVNSYIKDNNYYSKHKKNKRRLK